MIELVWLTLWFGLLTLYVTAMVGVSGGPCHGDHPLVCNLAHLILFLIFGDRETDTFRLYLVLLSLALALSVYALRIRTRTDAVQTWACRVLMLGLHVGMFAIRASSI